jgi:hypothetical protein
MSEMKVKRDGLNCKIENKKCADQHKGSYGACRLCEFSTITRAVNIDLSMKDYQFLVDLCAIDGTVIQNAVTELVNQGIRSLRRHVK